MEFVRLDYLRDASGGMIYKPAADFKIQADGAYSEYSFTAIRIWDLDSMFVD